MTNIHFFSVLSMEIILVLKLDFNRSSFLFEIMPLLCMKSANLQLINMKGQHLTGPVFPVKEQSI